MSGAGVKRSPSRKVGSTAELAKASGQVVVLTRLIPVSRARDPVEFPVHESARDPVEFKVSTFAKVPRSAPPRRHLLDLATRLIHGEFSHFLHDILAAGRKYALCGASPGGGFSLP
jgi:hypothetical protein